MKIVQLLLKVARNTYSISRFRLLKLGYGKRFQVGQDVVVRYGFTVRMEDRLDSRIQIGSGTYFNDGCALNSMSSIVIGDKCLFGQVSRFMTTIMSSLRRRFFLLGSCPLP